MKNNNVFDSERDRVMAGKSRKFTTDHTGKVVRQSKGKPMATLPFGLTDLDIDEDRGTSTGTRRR